MRVLRILIRALFPIGTVFLALPFVTEAVPWWIRHRQQLVLVIAIGLPVYLGVLAIPGCVYAMLRPQRWRTEPSVVRVWIKTSLIVGAAASVIGTVWSAITLGPLAVFPLVTAVLCILELRRD